MVIKKKTAAAVKSAKKSPSLKGVRSNTHSLREQLEAKGVGMLAFGSYLAKKVDVSAVEALSDVSPKGMVPAIMVMQSGKGQIIRAGKADFGRGIFTKDGLSISTDMFPDGEMSIVQPSALITGRLAKRSRAVQFRFNTKGGPELVTGMLFSAEAEGDYATLVVVSKGKVTGIRDVEFRTNKYNAGKTGRIVKELPRAELLPALKATFE